MICQSTKCDAVASWIIYWPGQNTRMCGTHKDQAEGIASAMGFDVCFARLGDDATPVDVVATTHYNVCLQPKFLIQGGDDATICENLAGGYEAMAAQLRVAADHIRSQKEFASRK